MHVLLDNSLKTASRNTHILNTDAVLYTFTNIFSTLSHRDHMRRRVVWTMRFEATFSLCCICCAVWISKKKSRSLPRSSIFSLEMDSGLRYFTDGWWPAMSRYNILPFGRAIFLQRCAMIPHRPPHTQHIHWRQVSTKCKTLDLRKQKSPQPLSKKLNGPTNDSLTD